MDPLGFYDAGPLRQTAINLFYGWGYNFYREENQLRADDQLVRSKAAWLLGLAHKSVETAESAYRRERFAPPSRERPFPDADTLEGARTLERLGREVGALVSRLQALPVPENDRMTQRYRNEAETLRALCGCDEALVGQCERLRAVLEGRPYDWLLENLDALASGLAAIAKTLADRERCLT